MASIKDIKFRRRRESKTNYRKRLALVKSNMCRIVVRKSNKRIMGQIVKYEERGDKVLAYAGSEELKKFNWQSRANRSTAYLTGLLLAKKAKSLSQECILDIGLSQPVKNSIPFVFAKGCVDGGLKINGSFDIDAKVYDLSGSNYAKELKEKDPEKYKKEYSSYIKAKLEPESLHVLFEEVKKKI